MKTASEMIQQRMKVDRPMTVISIRVPEDVSLIHLAWDPQLKGWAGVDRQNEMIGARALDLVVEQLNANERGIPEFPKMVLVGDRWVDGRTVSGPRTAQ